MSVGSSCSGELVLSAFVVPAAVVAVLVTVLVVPDAPVLVENPIEPFVADQPVKVPAVATLAVVVATMVVVVVSAVVCGTTVDVSVMASVTVVDTVLETTLVDVTKCEDDNDVTTC